MSVKKTSNKVLDFTKAKYENSELVEGKIQLKVVNTIDGVDYYYSTGSVEFETIDLSRYFVSINQIISNIELPNGCSYKIYTATSNDNFHFTPYVQINDDGTIASPQNKYVKIKLELFGKEITTTKIVHSFSSNQSSNFKTNNYVDFNEGLKLKSTVSYSLTPSSSFNGNGTLYVKSFNKMDFKTIETMGVRF